MLDICFYSVMCEEGLTEVSDIIFEEEKVKIYCLKNNEEDSVNSDLYLGDIEEGFFLTSSIIQICVKNISVKKVSAMSLRSPFYFDM